MIGADSLAFLSRAAMLSAIGADGCCDACFTGEYPFPVSDAAAKDAFEAAIA